MSTNRLIRDEDSVFLQFFANDSILHYWNERYKNVDRTDDAEFLDRSLCIVMLSNEHQIRQNLKETKRFVSKFERLVDEPIKLLKSAIKLSSHKPQSSSMSRIAEKKEKSPRERKFIMAKKYQEFEDMLVSRYLTNQQRGSDANADDRLDFASSIKFVTTLHVAGCGQIALMQEDANKQRNWMSFCKFAHWIATRYLRSDKKTLDPRLDNSMRLSMARLMFNCALRRNIYEHKYLLKAFQYFEGAIERRVQNGRLIRRIDSNIIPSGWSLTAILNMAACLLELRLPSKCRDLVKLARKLMPSSSPDTDNYPGAEDSQYLEAYADYVEGVSHFEDTSPLRSGLNCSSIVRSPSDLSKSYESAKLFLKASVDLLTQNFERDPLTASAVTMLAVVLANSNAAFSTEALQRFDQAVNLEIQLTTRTTTANFLLRILYYGANLRSDPKTSPNCQELYKKLSSFFNQTPVKSSGLKNNPASTTFGERLTETDFDSDEKRGMLAVFRVLAESKQFLDGYKQESLTYFKTQMHNYCEIKDIPVRALCLLCQSRHYINAQDLTTANYHQKKAAKLLSVGFNVKLDINHLSLFTFNDFQSMFPEDHRTLIFLSTFWLINEGLLLIEQANEQLQKAHATSLVPRDNDGHWSQRVGTILSSALLKARQSVDVIRFSQSDESVALDCLNQAKDLIQELNSNASDYEIFAFVFLEDCLAIAFYKLDRIISVDDRYKTDAELMFSVTELLKEADNSVPGPDMSSQSAVLDYTAFNLTFCLHKAQVNFPELLALMQKFPDQFQSEKFNRDINYNLDVIFAVSHPGSKLELLQIAYDLCEKAQLADSELHALIHMHAGMELLQQAYRDPTRPPYCSLNASILKFRKAARILELLHSDDVKTAYCYIMLGLLYMHNAQLEDQHSRCISCLKKCLSIEKRLIVKDTSPTPWLWKGLEIVQFFQRYFSQISKDYADDTSFSRDLDVWNELSRKFLTAIGRKKPLYYLQDFGIDPLNAPMLLTELLTDPLTEWEEKRNRSLKAIAGMMRDREFPSDSPPSDTEIRCYSHYLTKLFNRHLVICPVPHAVTWDRRCKLDQLKGDDRVERNHFLRGLNTYPQCSAQEKMSILKRLQRNQNLLLKFCREAEKFHDGYEVSY